MTQFDVEQYQFFFKIHIHRKILLHSIRMDAILFRERKLVKKKRKGICSDRLK